MPHPQATLACRRQFRGVKQNNQLKFARWVLTVVKKSDTKDTARLSDEEVFEMLAEFMVEADGSTAEQKKFKPNEDFLQAFEDGKEVFNPHGDAAEANDGNIQETTEAIAKAAVSAAHAREKATIAGIPVVYIGESVRVKATGTLPERLFLPHTWVKNTEEERAASAKEWAQETNNFAATFPTRARDFIARDQAELANVITLFSSWLLHGCKDAKSPDYKPAIIILTMLCELLAVRATGVPRTRYEISSEIEKQLTEKHFIDFLAVLRKHSFRKE